MSADGGAATVSVRRLVLLAVPALGIGIGSALVLWLLDITSEWLQGILWTQLPAAFGATGSTWWWILGMLTLVGLVVGLVVQFVPGHAGRDSATTELTGAPPPLLALPSLALVVIIGLAGGVSLGPENPIMAINASLAVALIARITTKVPPALVVLLSSAATIGALFGTPVAAALILPGMVGAIAGAGSLWDKLFLPLAAAGAGSITMLLLGGQSIAFQLEPMGAIQPVHLLWGLLVAAMSALVGVVAAWMLPILHRGFRTLKHPVVFTTVGGLVLGILGVIGGPMTLFKGLEESGELLTHPDDFSAGQLALFAGVKVLALVVAAAAGFRGGRIFPAVFIGVALGLLAADLLPDLPIALAVACGVMGIVLASTRDGWIAMFVAIALVGDVHVLAVLCVLILPVWLLVTKAPELIVHRPANATTPDWV